MKHGTFHIFNKNKTARGAQQNLVHSNWTSLAPDMIFQSLYQFLEKNKKKT
jgi:hypothetical protein